MRLVTPLVVFALGGCHLVFGVDVPEIWIAPDGRDPRIDARGSDAGGSDATLVDARTVDAVPMVDADLTTLVSFTLPGPLCEGAQATGQLRLSGPISSPFTVTLAATQAAISFPTNTFTFQPATWSTPINVLVDIGVASSLVDVYVTAPDGVFILPNNSITVCSPT